MSRKNLTPFDHDAEERTGTRITNPMSKNANSKFSSSKDSRSSKHFLTNGPYGAYAGKLKRPNPSTPSSSPLEINGYKSMIPDLPQWEGKRPTELFRGKLNSGLAVFEKMKAVAEVKSTKHKVVAAFPHPLVMSTIGPIKKKKLKVHDMESKAGPMREQAKKIEDDVQWIDTTVSNGQNSHTPSNQKMKPERHEIQILAAWIIKFQSNPAPLAVSRVVLSLGLLEIYQKDGVVRTFSNDDIVQIRPVLFRKQSHGGTFKLSITIHGGDTYWFYGTNDFQIQWLHQLKNNDKGDLNIAQMDDNTSSKIEALYFDGENARKKRASVRIEAMKCRDESHESLKYKDESSQQFFNTKKKEEKEVGQISVASFYNPPRSTRASSKSHSQSPRPKLVNDAPEYIPPPATNEEIFKFPDDGSKFAISVREQDMHRLNSGEFLNDTVIEFCFRHFQHQFPEKCSKVKFFSSYFYSHLTSNPETGVFGGGSKAKGWNYEKVESWTKGFDIFSVDFIIVPINESLHWYLAIIINPGAVLLNPIEDISDDAHESNSEVDEVVSYNEGASALAVNLDTQSQEESMDIDMNTNIPATIEGGGPSCGLEKSDYDGQSSATKCNQQRDMIRAISISSSERDENDCYADRQEAALIGGGEKSDGTVSLTSDDNYGQGESNAEGPLECDSEDELQVIAQKQKARPITTQQKKKNSMTSNDSSWQLEERKRREMQKEEEKRRKKEEKEAEAQKKKDEEYKTLRNKCTIVILDSLNIQRSKAHQALKEYLIKEATTKKAEYFKGRNVNLRQIVNIRNNNVPTQPNHFDCGVYLVKYVETILNDPEKYIKYLLCKMNKKTQWFVHQDIIEFRVKMKSIMEYLSDEYQKNHPKIPYTLDTRSGKSISPSTRRNSRKSLAKNQSLVDEDDSDVIIID